jgi:hypothetical protein
MPTLGLLLVAGVLTIVLANALAAFVNAPRLRQWARVPWDQPSTERVTARTTSLSLPMASRGAPAVRGAVGPRPRAQHGR